MAGHISDSCKIHEGLLKHNFSWHHFMTVTLHAQARSRGGGGHLTPPPPPKMAKFNAIAS